MPPESAAAHCRLNAPHAGYERARGLGLRRVRNTCDKANVTLAKTILRNGGVPEEEERMPAHCSVVSRYRAEL